jgi:cytoskeletal protein CcmA (bactofilin family)
MTTIGPSLLITGDVTSQEDVTVHGTVKGHINMEGGALRVAEHGHVYADVRGSAVTIDGALDGSVTGALRVELTPGANVTGTLTTPMVVIHDGATFNGLIDMDRQAKGKNPARLKLAGSRAPAQVVSVDEERDWGT